ncbi:diphosphomevalonate decarboxylase [Clostridium folliculivorans]|uniref:diphosphomevalonate decarboxylase n=2 Tax=Clostridium folliculivorans TaxID=2886038 RepID=A0A9W6D9G5_9CLOT|nr:diphosphomevalonate decarboxylase [Clostridium folliculivorans]GKU29863.1 diphosphomevalonate decarboxylase [Clostridium folliculivorans]
MKATAVANTNIALIKYWGKRDETLFLPMNSSLSITLDRFFTLTTVEFNESFNKDIFFLNNIPASEKEENKVFNFLNKVRQFAGTSLYARIYSENRVPTAAGFASSASGFAALAAASTRALDLQLSEKELSTIARQGSGSACRSIYGGFVEWQMGMQIDGSDSFAKQILSEEAWDISVLSVLLATEQKKVSSTEGMKRTVETSPFYPGWLSTVEKDLIEVKEAIRYRDFERLGIVVESNSMKMHATMLGANPPILYWQSGTIDVIHHIHKLRLSGTYAYFTIDAGPNVKVLCLPKDEKKVYESLLSLADVQEVIICHPGSGIKYLE